MGIESFTRPFAFDRVFDFSATDARRNPEDQALQILALQAELAIHVANTSPALAQARAEGFAAGLAQARSETATAILQAETMLIDQLASLEAEFAATEARVAASAAKVAMAAAEAIAAQAIALNPCQAIDAAIDRVLAQVGFRETLHVHAHPQLVAPLQVLIEQRAVVIQRPLAIHVHAEPALAAGDAHILWEAGGLQLDAAARAAAVRDVLGLDLPGA